MRTNAALPLLAADLVAVDAFSQALTNPLLSDHLFNEQTFTKVGMEVIKSTTCLSDILNRNLPAGSSRYYLSMTRDEKQLRDGLPLAGAPAAIALAAGSPGRSGAAREPAAPAFAQPRRCVPAAGCVVPNAADRAGRAPLRPAGSSGGR